MAEEEGDQGGEGLDYRSGELGRHNSR